MLLLWIILSIVGLLALLIIIAAAVGRTIPQDHVVCSTLTLTSAKPEQVFDLCADLAGWTKWAGVDKMTPLGQEQGRDMWRMQMGRNAMKCGWTKQQRPGTLEISVTDDRPKKFFEGRWVYTIKPAGAGSTIELVEHGAIHSAIARFMVKFADPAMYLKRHLKFVARHFGEEPRLS